LAAKELNLVAETEMARPDGAACPIGESKPLSGSTASWGSLHMTNPDCVLIEYAGACLVHDVRLGRSLHIFSTKRTSLRHREAARRCSD